MAFEKRVAVVIGAVVIVAGVGVLWESGVTSGKAQDVQVVSAENSSSVKTVTVNAQQQNQPTYNGKPITASDWHAVGPFYFVKGSVSKVETKVVPADVKGPVWTDVVVAIDGYVNSKAPQTQDGSMQIGGSSSLTFYDLVDKGQNHLHTGDQVIIKCAEYTTPAGKIVWGSKYDDIYYKTNKGYMNNKGDVIS